VSNYDPTDLASHALAENEADLRKRMASEVEELDLKWLMSSKRGRRIVWRLLEQSGVFRLSFNTNAMQMAFNEGNRNYGNRTLSLIHAHCPELYPVLVKESTNAGSDGNGSKSN
jgi:hypothetical protein